MKEQTPSPSQSDRNISAAITCFLTGSLYILCTYEEGVITGQKMSKRALFPIFCPGKFHLEYKSVT